jgi:YHYH protein
MRVRSVVLSLIALVALTVTVVKNCCAQAQRVEVLDPRALPLGDGKVSSGPRRGYVYSCVSQFRGGGAQHAGDWIRGSVWDSTGKIHVQGEVRWPAATFVTTIERGERRVSGNGLPLAETTGIFPVRRNDPAYRIDRNPNSIESQQMSLSLPVDPTPAEASRCVPMGMIGVALNGVAIFNALDAAGRDAVAHEVQDRCSGHPQRKGIYHYHGPSSCIPGATARNVLIGYALDGFGIYSMYDDNGKEVTDSDLDECHGRVSRITWDGRDVKMYHYVLTREYPYTVGCFRGKPAGIAMNSENTSPERKGPPGPRQPPEQAIAACVGHSPEAQCGFTSRRGDAISGRCRSPAGSLACVPSRR